MITCSLAARLYRAKVQADTIAASLAKTAAETGILPTAERTPMMWKLDDSKTIIDKIVAEVSQSTKRTGKQRILTKWRDELEREPPHMKLFQIDEIVREVQRRLKSIGK